MQALYQTLDRAAADYNHQVEHAALKLRVTAPQPGRSANTFDQYLRFMVSTSLWLLSVRGRRGVIEFFSMPISAMNELTENETPSRLKLRLTLDRRSQNWHLNDAMIADYELQTILRSLMKDVAVKSKGDFDLVPEALRFPLSADGQSLATSVKDLVLEKNMLAQKLVTQQEAIQNRIARDIHDAVISSINSVKRSITGETRMPNDQMVRVLNETINRLRDICQDLTPFMVDFELAFVLEDLVDKFGERTEINCSFRSVGDAPDFPDEIKLHIFRIAQECMNNTEKYAHASNLRVYVGTESGVFTLKIQDDGKGFQQADLKVPSREGGKGTGIMKERTELISGLFPAQLLVDSKPNEGTTTTLAIQLPTQTS